MTSTKKIICSLGVIAMAIVIALHITTLALALGVIRIQTPVSVSYTSTQVSANVSATYKQANASTSTSMTSGGKATVVLDATQSVETVNLTCPDITLTSDNQSVVFVYTFENTGDTSFYIDGEFLSSQKDIVLSATSDEDISDDSIATENVILSNKLTQITVLGHKTANITITITMTSTSSNAIISNNFQWTITNTIQG